MMKTYVATVVKNADSTAGSMVKSYASAISKLAESSSFKILLRFPVDINGELGFIFSKAEMLKAAKEYKYAIVMKFMCV